MTNQYSLEIGVVAGRHKMPVTEFMFAGEQNMDMERLAQEAEAFMRKACEGIKPFTATKQVVNQVDYLDVTVELYFENVAIYAAGFTPALIAAINAARHYARRVVVFHFDNILQEYLPQGVE